MVILGALANGLAAVVGGLIGTLCGSRVDREAGDFLMVAIGLCVVMTGVQGMAVEGGSALMVTLGVSLGGLLGYVIDLDGLVRRLGDAIQARCDRRFAGNPAFADVSRGFVSSTLVICIGSMAIVGSLESGLALDHSMLLTKSAMDFVINVLLATTTGGGVMLSGVAVFAYEGLLSLGASLLAPLLSEAVITQVMVTGSLLIFVVGTNLCGITDIKVANLLPACVLPVVLVPLLGAVGML